MKKITTERELFELPIGSVVKTADRYEDGELDYRGDVLVLEEEGWLFDNCCGRHMGAAGLWKSDGEGGLFLLYRPEEVNQ